MGGWKQLKEIMREPELVRVEWYMSIDGINFVPHTTVEYRPSGTIRIFNLSFTVRKFVYSIEHYDDGTTRETPVKKV